MNKNNLKNLASIIAKALSQESARIDGIEDLKERVTLRENKDSFARELCTEILRSAQVEDK